jgi:hypothetical protein
MHYSSCCDIPQVLLLLLLLVSSCRMQLLRVLCDYCEADQKLQQLQQEDT